MLQILVNLFLTLDFFILSTLIGIHLGRRAVGLTDRWEGWDKEIDFFIAIMRGRR